MTPFVRIACRAVVVALYHAGLVGPFESPGAVAAARGVTHRR